MKKRWRKILWIFTGLTVVGLVIAGTWAKRVLGSFQSDGMSLLQVWRGISDPLSKFPDQNRITILVVGQDYNHDRHGYAYTKNSRADTIILISADLVRKQLSAVSVPRDTFIEGNDGKRGKVNAVFARGGIELLKETLERRFDIRIDYHVALKPDAVKEIVDSVGGINVETIDEMNYDDSWGGLHVHLPAGPQKIDGEQAVGFVRFREVNRYKIDDRGRMIPLRNVKSSKEEGDIRRTARQQQLIRALVTAANSPSNLWRADRIVNTGFGQIETSLERVQVLALATLFKGGEAQGMRSATLPGTDDTGDGAYYWKLDEERAKATIDWLLKGDELAGRSLVRVSVKNATKTTGAALAASELVKAQGFSIYATGKAETAAVSSVTFYKSTFEEAAKEVAHAIGISTVTKGDADKDSPYGPEILVTIGADKADSLVARS